MKSLRQVSPTQIILLSFLLVMIAGSILLSLPISSLDKSTRFIDHFLVSASSTCVTGLLPFSISSQYTVFGQIVVLVLIQIGGLGFLTLLNLFYLLFQKKVSLTNKIIMKEALNLNTLKDVGLYIKRVVDYTLIFEIIGTVLLSIVFVPEFGLFKGIYYSLFHSVSAFCNAGIDVLGSNSFVAYQSNVLVNLVISFLVIAGGLGFIVWIDIADSVSKYKEKYKVFKLKNYFNVISLHTKISVVLSILLLFVGTVMILALEFNNVSTIGNMNFLEKLLTCFFHSASIRTAGFTTIDCSLLTDATKIFMCMFMYIGGCPGSTAGGIKTVTFAIIVLYVYAFIKGHQTIKVMKRSVSEQVVRGSLTIGVVSIFILIVSLFMLLIVENRPIIDLILEVFSAITTVGISAHLTPLLSDFGKIIIIILMYIGRLGPMTLVLLFSKRNNQMKGKDILYPNEDVLIG